MNKFKLVDNFICISFSFIILTIVNLMWFSLNKISIVKILTETFALTFAENNCSFFLIRSYDSVVNASKFGVILSCSSKLLFV